MNLFSVVFAIALVTNTALRLWLGARQARRVRAGCVGVPTAFAGRITPEAHRRAAEYTSARLAVSRVETVYGALLLVMWTVGGGLDLLARLVSRLGLAGIAGGVVLLVAAFLLMGLLDLPFALWRTFGVEQRFGFNHTTPALFLTDLAKQVLLALALGAPLAMAVLWLMGHAGGLWWLYAWLLWTGFSLLIAWVWPTLIAPLFNRFTPLSDQALAARIERLLSRNGFATRGVFVMDGSRRSGHGNAYFTGLGRAKRVVFFDTLLETLDADEVEAVLAHEIGHFKHHHVAKQLTLATVMALVGLAALGYLYGQAWFYHGLGVGQASTALALLLFLLAAPVFTFPLQPAMAWFSRRHEFEADAFAAREAGPATLVRALVKLYRDNATTLTPDHLYSAFHDSHPPAPVRIAALEAQAG